MHIRSVLPLDVTSDQLLAAIQATVAGLAVTSEPFGQTKDAYAASNTVDGIGLAGRFEEHLTARETAVLHLMALGLGNKEIASRLEISEHTAKFHVSSILAKLGAAIRSFPTFTAICMLIEPVREARTGLGSLMTCGPEGWTTLSSSGQKGNRYTPSG